jgi:NADH-quinone oxidoreductase subunit M
MYQQVFYGQIQHDENKTLPEIDGRERISLVPLIVMAVIMGVASPYWMKSIEPAVTNTLPKAGTVAQAQKSQVDVIDQSKQDTKTARPASAAAVTVPTDSATGGQK